MAAAIFHLTTGVVYVRSFSGSFSGSSVDLTGALSFNNDTFLTRDAADILAQRNGTTAQAFRVYNTFTSLLSGEYFGVDWKSNANIALVATRTFATGTTRPLILASQGTNANASYAGIQVARTGNGTIPFVHLGLLGADGSLAVQGTSVTGPWVTLLGGISSTATSGSITATQITPTYNQASGTAANTDLLINRTQTAIGSGAQKFLDLQVGGAPRFTILNTGGISEYRDVATAGWGVPAIQASARSTAQTAAVASVATYTVGAADGTFEVSANVLVTTSTTHDFDVQVTYTDEGNTARTATLPFRLVGSTTALVASITDASGAVPYMGVPLLIRAKAATAITVITEAAGTYTTVTYNVEGLIKQVA